MGSAWWDWFLLAVLAGVVGLVVLWLVRNAGPVRTAFDWFELAIAVGVAGFLASMALDGLSNAYKAYGEVPIPGSESLHLPAGDVLVSFRADVGQDEELPIPRNLELVIAAPSGVPQPSVTNQLGGTFAISGTPGITSHARQQVKVVHIPVAGDYTVTTSGNDRSAVNPRLVFGRDSLFGSLMWALGGLAVVGLVGCLATWRLGKDKESDGGPTVSDRDLLASGQRVRGVLKSFAEAETPARRRGKTPSQPELPDAPYYTLQVELWMPTLVRVVARNRQQVPLTEVPKLAVGRELSCVVDLAEPATRFLVDWNYRLD